MRFAVRPLHLALGLLLLAAVFVGSARLGGFAQDSQSDRSFLADLISRALSTDTSQVSIGQIEGALSSDATIRDIVLSDRDGPWLRLDRARLQWTRTALLFRRLEINRLELGRLEILRKPLPNPAAQARDDAPILPELPLKVNVGAFQLGELALGQPVLGTAARLGATGQASLGPPAEGLNLTFDARRLDRPGELALRLLFVPQSTRLELAVRLDEPEGGLLATMADLPGRPPVRLDLNGAGPLDSFQSTLNFTAGPEIGAQGSANLARAGAGRELALGLEARIAGLMPAPVAPVFAGATRLDGSVGFRDDGGVDIRTLALVSALARLDIAGRYAADRTIDLKVTAAARPNQDGKTVAAEAAIGKLALDASIVGPIDAPRVQAKLDAAEARTPQATIGRLALTFDATPSGTIGAAGSRIALTADGDATGVALTDPGLARLVGNRVVFTLRGTAGDDGVANFETLRLALSGIAVDYTGTFGNARALGDLRATIPDLSRLSGLAGRPLSGDARLTARIDGTPRTGAYNVTLDGEGDRLGLSQAELDRLIGGRLSLTGRVGWLAGELDATGLRAAGRHVTLTADGTYGANSDMRIALALPDLRRADPRLTGNARGDLRITGPQSRLDARVELAMNGATALGRPIQSLALDATVRDLQGALETQASLAGQVEGKALAGRVRLARTPENAWNLPELAFSLGSVRLDGNLTLDSESRAAGALNLAAGDLDDLSALALTKLSGAIDARIALAVVDGGQNAEVNARAQKLAAASFSLERLDAALTGRDLYRRPMLDGTLTVDRAVIAGEQINSVRFVSKGTPAGSDFTLAAAARGFGLDGAGRLVPGEPLALELARFSATRDGRRIALAKPASFRFPAGGVEIAGLSLAVESGRIDLSGRAGETLDLDLVATAVPLSAVRIFAPTLDLAGRLDARADIGGTAAAPTGPWQLRIAGLASAETRRAGLPAIEIAGSGALAGGRTSLDATLRAGSIANLRVSGSVPLAATGNLDVMANGRVDAAIANTALAVDGRRVTGTVTIDVRAGGSVSQPRLSGNATLAGGTFTDALQGIRLTAIQAAIAARGEDITIERATASTPNGGTLSASGRVRLDPGAGFPGSIRLQGSRAQLVDNGIVTAVADLALDLSGPLAQRPRIAGRVDVVSLEVAVPDRLPSSLRPVDNIRHVNARGTAAARLAAARKAGRATRGGRAAPAFDAALAITVSAPNRVFIRGRGLDAELGGQIAVAGTLAQPAVNGAFELRRGRLEVLAQRLDFSRGRLTFSGGVIPELDFVAETRAGDVTAQVIITGPADQPSFAFTSQPQLPQDEVLSRILFARASGSLSPFQALQLAQAAAQFSGGGGDDTFERLRRSLGVDNLDIQVGQGGPTVGLSRYIGNNVSIGVKAGARPEDSGISINIDVTRRLKVQAETGADGRAAVGAGAEWEW